MTSWIPSQRLRLYKSELEKHDHNHPDRSFPGGHQLHHLCGQNCESRKQPIQQAVDFLDMRGEEVDASSNFQDGVGDFRFRPLCTNTDEHKSPIA